ncbi:MAG: hypothetical protein LLG21_04470 [Euryarchaeota archaeon]|nr:hypothetical protein [Euryarchaeota archaeon]
MEGLKKSSDKTSDKRASGRPNQGKTETIRQRKIDVYLPTLELMQQWKHAAEKSGMPLSKYILEVVEQHRMGAVRVTMPPALLEEKANKLEKELAALQMRFDTLNLAFHNQEVELSRLSSAYQSAKGGSLDVTMVKDLVQVLQRSPKNGFHIIDLMESMKFDKNDSDMIKRWSDGLNFLLDVGLVLRDDKGNLRWKDAR